MSVEVPADRFVCVGSYTEEAGGSGTGITAFWQDASSGQLAAVGSVHLAAPSFLAWHPTLPVLYAVNELDDGSVTALECDDAGELGVVAMTSTGGGAPCHLVVAEAGTQLFAANYGGGSVAVIPLDRRGHPGQRTDLAVHTGSGPIADRQEGPHPHMVLPDGELVLVPDLGIDEIRGYRVTSSGTLELQATSVLPPGTGPRQLVRAGARSYLVGELSSTVSLLDQVGPGAFTVARTVAATSRAERNFPAQICVQDGLVYVSNRGADSIAVFDPDLEPLGEYPSGGGTPRHMAFIGGWLYVANQGSNVLAAFAVDGGRLTPAGSYPVSTPACVAARPT